MNRMFYDRSPLGAVLRIEKRWVQNLQGIFGSIPKSDLSGSDWISSSLLDLSNVVIRELGSIPNIPQSRDHFPPP